MKIATTIQLTDAQISLLKKESIRTGNSVSSVIRVALDQYLGGLDAQ